VIVLLILIVVAAFALFAFSLRFVVRVPARDARTRTTPTDPAVLIGHQPTLEAVLRSPRGSDLIPAPRSARREPSRRIDQAATTKGTIVSSPFRRSVLLEPTALAFADATNTRPFLFELGVEQGRAALDEVQSGSIVKPEADITDLTVPGGPHGEVAVRIVKPIGASGALPVVLFIHGAGWVFGDPITHDRLIRRLAVGAGAAVVFPDYRRSPEARYPSAIEECYTVAQWVRAAGAAHGLDGNRMAVAGDSVGGNIAAALTLLSKQRSGPTFAGQLLFYPVTNAVFDTGSYRQFAEGYHLRRDAMIWFWDQYSTEAQRAEITASPLRATNEQLTGLPPALVITAQADVLRDEGEAYARKLRIAGVPVTARRYPATIHDFVMVDAMADSDAAQAATTQAIQFLTNTLSRTQPPPAPTRPAR
jgi:acetyl esterase/lipase